MEARCSRWGGGPAMPRGKVLGSDAAGRSPFKCHEEVSYLQPFIPPKRFFHCLGDAQEV